MKQNCQTVATKLFADVKFYPSETNLTLASPNENRLPVYDTFSDILQVLEDILCGCKNAGGGKFRTIIDRRINIWNHIAFVC